MKKKFSIDPLADFRNYREAMRQIIEEGWVLPRDLMPSAMNAIVVPVDVLDNGPEIVIKANLPGVKPDDVSIRVQGKHLAIKATTSDEIEMKGATYLRQERKASTYMRTLSLPMAVDADRADAYFKNGVLTLILPKSETLRPRVIKVQTE